MHVHSRPQLAAQCSVCGTMLSGALSAVYRTFGIKRSPRNPNICTRCSTHVEEGRMVEITVLFADLSSFTEMTQDLGAEKTHEVVDAFLRMATEVLVKHGAFIDKYVGDAVMALFNVPIRHDDHALRAVTAATELSMALKTLGANFGLNLKASIGIATGFARVGRLGSDDSKDYTAIGDVVNLAARLQSKASAGEVLISEESYRKHAANFAAATSEQVMLKGFRDPVSAYRLLGDNATRLIGDPPEHSPARGDQHRRDHLRHPRRALRRGHTDRTIGSCVRSRQRVRPSRPADIPRPKPAARAGARAHDTRRYRQSLHIVPCQKAED